MHGRAGNSSRFTAGYTICETVSFGISRSQPNNRTTRQMSDTTVLCRNNGPYWIIGDFKLVDAEGNPIEIPENKRKTTPEGLPRVALCRCGGSVIKPFCDGAHSRIRFIGASAAVQASDAANPPT